MTVMLSEWLRSTLVSPKSAMRAERLLSIKMLLYGQSAGIERRKHSTYAFQIRVNGRPVMEILQSTSDVRQLREVRLVVTSGSGERLPVSVDWSQETQ